ncbi:hypothetical protein EJB05_53571, partial [Eragrostis curvula]
MARTTFQLLFVRQSSDSSRSPPPLACRSLLCFKSTTYYYHCSTAIGECCSELTTEVASQSERLDDCGRQINNRGQIKYCDVCCPMRSKCSPESKIHVQFYVYRKSVIDPVAAGGEVRDVRCSCRCSPSPPLKKNEWFI